MSRIARGEMFMNIARVVAERGTCDRAKVGAVITYKGRIISIGYNGSYPGEAHCDDVGHLIIGGHCTRTIHAEVNAINFAEEMVKDSDGPIFHVDLYVTHLPCENCCHFIAKSNKESKRLLIKSVVYSRVYPTGMTAQALRIRHKILEDGGVDTIGQLEV